MPIGEVYFHYIVVYARTYSTSVARYGLTVSDLTIRPTLVIENCSEVSSMDGVDLLECRLVRTPAVAVVEEYYRHHLCVVEPEFSVERDLLAG